MQSASGGDHANLVNGLAEELTNSYRPWARERVVTVIFVAETGTQSLDEEQEFIAVASLRPKAWDKLNHGASHPSDVL